MFEHHKKESPILSLAGVGGGPSSYIFYSAAGGGYEISRSLKFNPVDRSHLYRTPSSASNRKTWTWAAWVKRGQIGAQADMFSAGYSGDYLRVAGFNGDDKLEMRSDSAVVHVKTTQVFRDPSAWYHIVIAMDTTIASPASDRVKFYVNGSRITDMETGTYPSQNSDQAVNMNGEHRIGAFIDKTSSTVYYTYDGYLADMHLVDGTALDPSSFGENDANGVWQPKEYTGSHGTNGFHMKFNDVSTETSLGIDSSSNNNNYTPENIVNTTVANVTAREGVDAITWSGNGSNGRNIGGLSFQPDLVWIKNQNNTSGYGHILVDAARGAGKYIRTDGTGTESTFGYVSAFRSDGFTISNHTEVNGGSNNYVAWCWKAGGAASANNTGSINANVSVSTTFGFSCLTYTGSGSAGTVAHGLGATPKWILVKNRDSSSNFYCYHEKVGTSKALLISSANAEFTPSPAGINAVSDTTFSLGSDRGEVNASGDDYVAYCWTEIPGFSKFGEFTHSGGGTIELGFKPKIWIVKEKDGTTPWYIFDSERDYFDDPLFANTSGAASSGWGFTWSDTSVTTVGGSFAAGTYIYAAFAAAAVPAALDSVIDTPTNATADSGNNIGNYCTWNPLTYTRGNILEGNQTFYGNGTNTPRITGTISASSGKWYYEATVMNDGPGTGSGDVHNSLGWGLDTVGPLESAPNTGAMNHSFYFMDSGYYKNFSGSNTNTSTGKWLEGDVIGVAANLDTNTLVFYKNNVQILSQTIGTTAGTRLCPALQSNTGNYGRLNVNWGQQPFRYTPPANHLPLCTENLPTPDISDGSDYFDTVLYEGDSSASRSVSGYSFSPDFLWVKDRGNNAGDYSHRLADSVRGAGVSVSSNSTDAERDASAQSGGGIETFTSGGFTIEQGTSNNNNQNNNNSNYVAWAWDAADSTSTNNAGATQSQVRVNSTSKFSIVKWTNPSGSTTVGHGLGVKPEVIFTKGLGSCEWQVYHESIGNNYKLYLDGDNARVSSSVWGTTDPTATLFTFDDNRTQDFIAYCFKSVDGYSSFGSYNAVTANSVYPFVYTGFRPAWVMHKRYDSGGTNVGDWRIWDSKRNTYNAATTLLFPNKNTQDATNAAHGLDILSNGFKIRTGDSNINPSSGNFVYFAFAENPFRSARAR